MPLTQPQPTTTTSAGSAFAQPAASQTYTSGRTAVALFAAWCCPGLGHYLLGQPRRAMVAGIAIGILWIAGLLVGGISVIDHRDDNEWFLRQVGHRLLAPSLVVDFLHQYVRSSATPPVPSFPSNSQNASNPGSLYRPSFGASREQGVLYTGMAGFLNLLLILHLIFFDPQHQSDLTSSAQSRPEH